MWNLRRVSVTLMHHSDLLNQETYKAMLQITYTLKKSADYIQNLCRT